MRFLSTTAGASCGLIVGLFILALVFTAILEMGTR